MTNGTEDQDLTLEEIAAIMAAINLYSSEDPTVDHSPPPFSSWQQSAMEFYKHQRLSHSLSFKRDSK